MVVFVAFIEVLTVSTLGCPLFPQMLNPNKGVQSIPNSMLSTNVKDCCTRVTTSIGLRVGPSFDKQAYFSTRIHVSYMYFLFRDYLSHHR